ncbi:MULTISPECIES: hypothetical protein [unclassified Streptomyces]|uniref:hypothetical protein n=1 Tax=unclassified Streptomyces TaxID=2593676 RepID=UPI0022511C10|nr:MULTISPECIES: hypothetical protein [unclassified Streptomyces]MCX4827619.1 hypothetical protein [Streptomyces sp. NBC_01016]
MAENDGGRAAWLESKRRLVNPERHIAALRELIAEDDNELLLYDYDLVSDPRDARMVRAQQRAAGQRNRRLKRLAARERHAAQQQCAANTVPDDVSS